MTIANNSIALANQKYLIRKTVRDQQIADELASSGSYMGYLADTQQHLVKLRSGKITKVKEMTNSGRQEGDRVAITADKQYFKAMPRG